MGMYHYKDSGLDNVWLIDGYTIRPTPYGEAVAVEDVEGLNRTIAGLLIKKQGPLTGKEFKFLRKALKMSQRALGEVIGAEEQTIARWEREITPVPETPDRFLRATYVEYTEGKPAIRALVERLNALDEQEFIQMLFARDGAAWKGEKKVIVNA